jgi:hypothetical protein
MKTSSVMLRAGTVMALCSSLLLYPALRVSASLATARVEVKSESQFRSEAALFNRALSAVASITTMKLDTGEDLKRALAILDRERPNLKLHRSKLVAASLSDATLIAAVKRRATDARSADSLIKELEADPKNVLKLAGAEALRSRLQQSAETDATTLRRVAQRLKDAGEKLQKAAQIRSSTRDDQNELKFTRVRFSKAPEPHVTPETTMAPGPGTVILIIIATAVVCAVIGYVGGRLTNYLDLEDDIAECQEGADRIYARCLAGTENLASGFPFFLKEAATALCYSEWLGLQALCIVAG